MGATGDSRPDGLGRDKLLQSEPLLKGRKGGLDRSVLRFRAPAHRMTCPTVRNTRGVSDAVVELQSRAAWVPLSPVRQKQGRIQRARRACFKLAIRHLPDQ